MILGSFAAPFVAWRALASMSGRPYAVAALVIGCIDVALIVIALAAMFFH